MQSNRSTDTAQTSATGARASREMGPDLAPRDWRDNPLRAATDGAPAGVAVMDRDLRYVYANRSLARLFGRPVPEIVGRTIHELLPAAEAGYVERVVQRVLETNEPVNVPPAPVQGEPGAAPHPARYLAASYYPAHDHTGAVVGVAATIFDVTDRVRRQMRERFLAEAGAILAASLDYQETLQTLTRLAVPFLGDLCIVDLLADGVIRRAAIAHTDPDIQPLAQRLQELDARSLAATHPVRRVIEERMPMVIPELTDAYLQAIMDPAHLAAAQALQYHSALVVPLIVRDRILGALSLLMTDSNRRYTEDDLPLAQEFARRAAAAADNARLYQAEHAARAAAERLQQEAESANIVKTQFLAAMSHELRTPLNAIGGYAQILAMGIHGPINEEQREDLERIERSQRHLLSVINDILNFARLEAGRVEYAIGRVPVRDLLDELETLVAPQVEARRIHYNRGDCDPAIAVRADREKLRQVLLNLVANAIKFTEPGGSVSVDCARTGGSVEIAVRDTGIGIPAERQESIFEPFVQVNRSLSRPWEGTGLGLAISRELARGMEGTLRVESTLGVGSTFTLTLPSG